jgi:hypothetical protein
MLGKQHEQEMPMSTRPTVDNMVRHPRVLLSGIRSFARHELDSRSRSPREWRSIKAVTVLMLL